MKHMQLCAAVFGGLLVAVALDATAATVSTATGANAPAIQGTVDTFRLALGVNNGVGNSFPSGRREINWDGVPDSSAQPNFLPPDFFNTTSPRGVVFSALEYETGSGLNDFMVSADSNNPTMTQVRFGNINASYAAGFQTFSAERLLHIRNAHAMDVLFFVPGTTIPATTRGFGVIFTDVDGTSAADRTVIRCYGPDASQIIAASVPAFNNGLTFIGLLTEGNERFARCNIEVGNSRLDAGLSDGVGGVDVVAMDDFIYGEPISIFQIFADSFD